MAFDTLFHWGSDVIQAYWTLQKLKDFFIFNRPQFEAFRLVENIHFETELVDPSFFPVTLLN